ncbi:MAG: CsgG/HfaB family protein [Burkholderiaceae bacterium]|jgi:TolB-like protein|nr:CsgG/HfaB family protein [Burkholderiaceae bacterium]
MRRRAALAGLAAGAAAAVLPARAQPGPAAAALPAVVVWDFDNQSPLPGQGEFLRRALSENLTAQLLRVPGLPVVERQRLREVLAEQKVAASELADAEARLRLGRIVGAARMVFGGFFVLGEQVQVHVRVVETATSRVLLSDEFSGELATVMQQVEALNRRLTRALGGAASPGLTYAAASWEAYDRALALADAGRVDDAITALQSLLTQDKNFHPAERQLVALLEKASRR